MSIEETDRQLLRVIARDPAAFELFYRRHVDRVVGFAARRLRDPADVAEEIYEPVTYSDSIPADPYSN